MQEYLEQCLTGPNLPASILMILIVLYGASVILGVLDIDLFDLDFDADADGSLSGLGLLALRFLNIGNVPVMIWASVFGTCWWTASLLLWFTMDAAGYDASWQTLAWLLTRNIALALIVTKVLTQPMIRLFEKTDHYEPEDLLGQECEISTLEATPEYGQAKLPTEGAPLLLNVRTEKEVLAKGERAVIVEFDPEKRVYVVTKAIDEV